MAPGGGAGASMGPKPSGHGGGGGDVSEIVVLSFDFFIKGRANTV